jgi:hypothetical protein
LTPSQFALSNPTAPLHPNIAALSISAQELAEIDGAHAVTLAADVVQKVGNYYSDFKPAIVVTDQQPAGGTSVIAVHFNSTSRPGVVGFATSELNRGWDTKNVIVNATQNVFNSNPSVSNFLLDEAINKHLDARVDIHVDSLLESEDIDFAQSSLGKAVAEAIAHEIGHTLGLPHTFRDPLVLGPPNYPTFRREISAPGTLGRDDIMRASIDLFPTANLEFKPGITAEILKLALNMNWTALDAFSAFSTYTQWLPIQAQSAAFGSNFLTTLDAMQPETDEPALVLPPSVGTLYADSKELVLRDVDFGQVFVDGQGGQRSDKEMLLLNLGDSVLDVRISCPLDAGGMFSIVGAAQVTLQPGDEHRVRVSFDPSHAGRAVGLITIESHPGGPTREIQVTGIGYVEAPDVVLATKGGNFGGMQLGGGTVAHPGVFTIENRGVNPLLVSSIRLTKGATDFELLGVPADLAVQPIILARGGSFSFGASFLPSQAGLRQDAIEIVTNDPTKPTLTASVVGTGLRNVVYPEWGNDYVAVEFPNQPETTTLRQRSDASGNFTLYMPPNEPYHEVVFDPVTGLVAHGYGRTSAAGESIDLSGTLVFTASTAPDSDFDGLPDDIEFAIGSSSASRDTDKDGLDDFAEINLNLDPLDGRGLPAGVLAVTGMRGEAKELVLAGRIDGAAGQTVYLATGSHGLAVVDARDLRRPIVVGQLDLPGDAVDVALDARLGIAAVATGTSLEVVDVSNPEAPTVLRSLATAAAQVEVVDGVAYVAVGSNIEAYDLLTGDHRETVPSGAGTIAGLTADGDFLFAADAAGGLAAIDLSGSAMAPTGVVSLPANSGRVFVGGGVAYVGGGSGEFNGGFVTVDVSNPAAMALISGADNTSIAGKSVVANGAGLALAVGKYQRGFPSFEQRSVLDVVDATDPANTGTSLARFVLPSPPHSLALGSGLAFVADGSAGLVVANYLPFDTLGQAPVVTATTTGADVDPASVGIQAREGSTLKLDLGMVDDRQIRNVEVLVDGRVVNNDVAYPWPSRLTLPKIAGIDDTVTIQVRAADTGGNVGLSAPITIQLVRDTVAPAIVSTNLPDGAVRGTAFRTVSIEFSEGIDPATVIPSTVVLTDGSGTAVVPLDMVLRRDGRELQLTYPTLAEGAYQLRLDAAAITDRAGNALAAADIVTSFTISDTSTVVWIGSNSGFWDDAANWSSGRVPQANEDVVINVAPGGVIEHRNGDTAIRSLTTNATFRLSGGTLSLAADSSITGALALVGGALDGTGTLTLLGTGNRWDGGAMRGGGTTRIANGADLLITGRQGALSLADRTLLNEGAVVVDRGGSFMDSTVVNLSGAVSIRNTGNFEIRSAASFGNAYAPVSAQRFDNRGLLKITATRPVQMALALANSGTVELASRAYGYFGATEPGVLAGTLVLGTNSTLDLRGSYSLADSAALVGDGRVTLSDGALTIGRSGELSTGLGITGGTVTVTGTLRVPSLAMSGGTLTGSGTLILMGGSSSWQGGTMNGGGTTVIEGGATLQLSGTAVATGDGTSSLGSGTAPPVGLGSGALPIDSILLPPLWSPASVNQDSSFVVGGGGGPLALGDRTLLNNGTVALGGTLEIDGTATIRSSGMISVAAAGLIADTKGSPGALTIDSLGAFTLPATAVTYELRGVSFSSGSSLDVPAGVLRLSGNGSASIAGALTIGAGGAIEQAGGTSRIDPGGPVSGLGILRVTGGTMTLAAGSFDQTLVLRDGTMLIETPVTARFVDMTGGNLSGAGPLTLTLPASELLGGIVTVPIVEPPDVVAPSILSSSLSNGWAISLPNGVTDGVMIAPTTILFSEPIKPSTLNAANLHLLTSSGLSVEPVSMTVRNDLRGGHACLAQACSGYLPLRGARAERRGPPRGEPPCGWRNHTRNVPGATGVHSPGDAEHQPRKPDGDARLRTTPAVLRSDRSEHAERTRDSAFRRSHRLHPACAGYRPGRSRCDAVIAADSVRQLHAASRQPAGYVGQQHFLASVSSFIPVD